ncbi:sulfotransferase domain-containing protein [Ruegeria sp. MALMAid1280]|uniref:sulfotransferase domain-containing protein n=1 Tax=Ruegeria sp. MALMAid1280 TaxID=3411634 RepID=UPI003B9F7CC2
MSKVEFIGIGAQKAATTWLHHVLSGHSAVTTGDTKELNFFTANYDRGYIWYESCFAEGPAGTIKGECSPTYFFSQDAPQRARDYNTDLKLICILRDPVERAYSNHLHEIRKGHIASSISFEDALAQNPAYERQSQYKMNLERWLDCFDRTALLLLFSEDISDDPKGTYDQICRHLAIAPDHNPAALSERHHETVTYRNPAVQRTLRRGGDMMRSLGMRGAVRKVKGLPGLKQALSMNRQHLKTKVAPPTGETRKKLTDLFTPDMEFVAKVTGRVDLPWQAWRERRDGV